MSLPKFAAGTTLAAALIVPLVTAVPHFGATSTAEASPTSAAPAVVATAPTPTPTARASRTGTRIALAERTIDIAEKFEGVPYRFGGTTPRGFDCSGYTRFVFAKLGKKLPRTSQQQHDRARKVKQPRVGDLLFYHSGSRKGPVYHVAIYAGRNRVWHAPNPGTSVKLGKIYAKYVTVGRY